MKLTRRELKRQMLIKEIDFIFKSMPDQIVKDMQACRQDKDYHPEGDVYAHTTMVVEQLKIYVTNTVEAVDIVDTDLILAVVYHDVGKPLNTQTHSCGKITSHGHCAVSEGLLIHYNIDELITGEALNLIRRHLDIFRRYGQRVLLKDNTKSWVRHTNRVNTTQLAVLSMVDALGRDTTIDQQEKALMIIEWYETEVNKHKTIACARAISSSIARTHLNKGLDDVIQRLNKSI